MDLSHGYCMVAVCLALTGGSHGAGVLPDSFNRAVGESVLLRTDQNDPSQMFTVTWEFQLDNGPLIEILNYHHSSSVEDIIGPNYIDRIELDKITGSLNLSSLTLEDSGTYSVKLSPQSALPTDGECYLKVDERVSGVTVTSNHTGDLLEFSSSVTMSCDVSSGTSLSYRWMNDSSEITASSDRVQVGDGNTTLTVHNVTRHDKGPYQCRVFNPISSEDSDPLTLQPIYGPENIKISAPADIVIDQMLKLSCEAESTPPADFTWMRGTEKIGSGAEFSKKATLSDSGEYTCVAVNKITKLEIFAVQSITVKAIEPPSDAQLSPGAIAGIVIAVIVAVVLVGALSYRIYTRRTSKRHENFNVSRRGVSNGNVA